MKRDDSAERYFSEMANRRRQASHRGSIDWEAKDEPEHVDVDSVVRALMARSDEERWPGGVPPPVEHHGRGVCPIATVFALPDWIIARWHEIEAWNDVPAKRPARYVRNVGHIRAVRSTQER